MCEQLLYYCYLGLDILLIFKKKCCFLIQKHVCLLSRLQGFWFIICPLGYERVHLPLCEGADAPLLR